MVILGLGSNVGDRLTHLRHALNFLKKTPEIHIQQISPIYLSDALLPDHAPTSWRRAYLNLALRCETTLSPDELLPLLKKIETAIGRKPEKRWAPRIMDIDILAWDDFVQYDERLHIPHESLHQRPFALWPLADIAPYWIYPLPGIHQGKTAAEMTASWGSRFSGTAPFHTKQIPHRIDTPQLVGILNVTPDSFSDGGLYCNPQAALQQLRMLADAGADVIDIGAESTHPMATPLTAEAEWQRLSPILAELRATLTHLAIPPKISIDTRHAAVAKKSLAYDVDWINDVSGLEDPAMREVIAAQSCDVVIMHHLGIPASRTHFLPPTTDVTNMIYQWAEQRLTTLEKNGIASHRVIVDVGIGFGKNAEQSLSLIQNIAYFKTLNTRLLVGHSRKTFLKLFTDKVFAEREIETDVVSLFLAKQNVDFIRVHQVELHARAFRVLKAIETV